MMLPVSGSQSCQSCHTEVCLVLFCSSNIPAKCLSGYRTDCTPMQKSPLYWQLFARQLLTDLLLLPPLAGTWLVFRDSSLINLRLLSLVDPGLRTLTHGGLLMTGVSICARPNLDIRGLKFDSKLKFEYHVRSIVSRVLLWITISQREACPQIYFTPWSLYLGTPLCYFAAIMHLFSQSFIIVLWCGGQLLNVTFSFLNPRCIRWSALSCWEFLVVVSYVSCLVVYFC